MGVKSVLLVRWCQVVMKETMDSPIGPTDKACDNYDGDT